jgi:hypothetical protein
VTRIWRESGAYVTQICVRCASCSMRIKQMLRAPAARGVRNKGCYFCAPLYLNTMHVLRAERKQDTNVQLELIAIVSPLASCSSLMLGNSIHSWEFSKPKQRNNGTCISQLFALFRSVWNGMTHHQHILFRSLPTGGESVGIDPLQRPMWSHSNPRREHSIRRGAEESPPISGCKNAEASTPVGKVRNQNTDLPHL